ncbi:MAG: GNAT family N-acetyltransferase, partial [Roseiflexaceae bacterium]|nr:GNAT family N-acetyltransferase [Roseiflexaceae bacterium]
ADDRDAVFAMVADVWDGTDYIPQVWDKWLHATDGPLLVGEREQLPVALCKLTALGPHEDWLEGVRVASSARGQGLARQLIRQTVELSRQRGKRTLRFQTSEENPTMHRLGEELGFKLNARLALYGATQIERPALYAPLDPALLPTLLDDLARSAPLEANGGLYTYRWTTMELNEDRLRAHLAQGEVVGLAGERAWAIITSTPYGGFWIGHIEGKGEQVVRLLDALRHTPAQYTPLAPEAAFFCRAHVVPDTPILPELLAAGYTRGQNDARVYEVRLL